MVNLGFLAAVGTAICWGSYMVPFKKTCPPAGGSGSLNLIQFQALMAVSIGLSGLIIAAISGFPLNLNIYALISGVLWTAANTIFLSAVSNLGLSRAVPIASSLVIISSFLWGSLVFSEMSGKLISGVFGIALIIFGVILIGSIGNAKSQNVKKGLISAAMAGLIWGSQLVPLKLGQVSTRDFFFPLCLGIFLSGLIIFFLKRTRFTKEALKESLLSGVIWNLGNLLSLVSLSLIGLSKMGPISQASTLIAVLWGLFYFKEITEKKAKMQVLIGAFILVIGLITLGLA